MPERIRRLWLAGPEGGGGRAGWFGLLGQDQLAGSGDAEPVRLVAMDDDDLTGVAEEIGAPDRG